MLFWMECWEIAKTRIPPLVLIELQQLGGASNRKAEEPAS